jgi:FAD/FMN-containing dehydrogenase
LIKAGGRVVKNVAGYDLCKLFTGSYGTLGTIVEVNFKLRPLPFESKTVLFAGPREELSRGAKSVIDSRLFPVAAELVSPNLTDEIGVDAGPGNHLLLLKFAGSRNAVTAQLQKASAFFQGESTQKLNFTGDGEEIWQKLSAI